MHPTDEESKDWNPDMFGYFKKMSDLLVSVNNNASYLVEVHEPVNKEAIEEIYNVVEGIDAQMNVNDVKGMDRNVLQDC